MIQYDLRMKRKTNFPGATTLNYKKKRFIFLSQHFMLHCDVVMYPNKSSDQKRITQMCECWHLLEYVCKFLCVSFIQTYFICLCSIFFPFLFFLFCIYFQSSKRIALNRKTFWMQLCMYSPAYWVRLCWYAVLFYFWSFSLLMYLSADVFVYIHLRAKIYVN